jgi:hypothetical protein
MRLYFTYWWWENEDKAYSWLVDSDWVITFEKSLWDEQILFDEIINKSFWYITEKKKYEVAKQKLKEWDGDKDTYSDFLHWLDNKLNLC